MMVAEGLRKFKNCYDNSFGNWLSKAFSLHVSEIFLETSVFVQHHNQFLEIFSICTFIPYDLASLS